jgi:large subunit ribosomal protein L19
LIWSFNKVRGFLMDIKNVLDIKANPNIPRLSSGDTVRVKQKVVEGEKTRIQVFQGVVIRIHNAGVGTNFTVRRVTSGVGVERTFPFYSPMIDGVEIIRHGKVRRAKLYYLRGLSARASRIKEKRLERLGEEIRPAQPEPESEASQEASQPTSTELPTAAAPEQVASAPIPVVEPPKDVAKEASKEAATKAKKPKAEKPKSETAKVETPKVEEETK